MIELFSMYLINDYFLIIASSYSKFIFFCTCLHRCEGSFVSVNSSYLILILVSFRDSSFLELKIIYTYIIYTGDTYL